MNLHEVHTLYIGQGKPKRRKGVNYKRLIANEYKVAKLNALNNPFNPKLFTRLKRVADVYRRSRPRQYGCDSRVMRAFYDELLEVR